MAERKAAKIRKTEKRKTKNETIPLSASPSLPLPFRIHTIHISQLIIK